MEINQICNMDCMDGLKQLYEENGKCIDAIITDPPYVISMKSKFHTMKRKGIDFGDWDKDFNLLEWIKPALNVLKQNGNIIIFSDWKNMSYLKDELEKHGCIVKEMLIWQKSNPMPRNRDRLYVTSCEYAIWAVNGGKWVFNRQRTNYENAIFDYPVVHHTKRLHPTQKPVELIQELVKIHTNENDTVLDPFMGSGTTAIACAESNRKFIGFENNENYYETAAYRLIS